MKGIITFIVWLGIISLTIIIAAAVRPHYQKPQEQLVKLTPAGQFIELVSFNEIKPWLQLHCNDRKIITLTGLGIGLYGADAEFVIVSEPIKETK